MAKYILVSDSKSDSSSKLSEQLMQEKSVEMVFSCQSYEETMDFANLKAFDIIFLRVGENKPEGLELVRDLKSRNPECRVIMMSEKEKLAAAASKAKADGFLLLPEYVNTYPGIQNQLQKILKGVH